ncbi:hypothetical protein HID58_087686 [Brassica napus]|uniref:PGG domain-containing protein n=1 Tax=Brassica napus TaxID=3708 RepID=A0ABQ7XWY5_BRANA|nr:hypothetical protein HID58_087686 [Brassica napus]
MDPRLLWVSRSGNVDALYSLIAKEPCLLKNLDLAKELIMFDSTLVRIPGRGEFLVLCPESIRDTNLNGETAFQITVMNDKYKELKILRGWVQRLHNSDSSSTENYVLNKCNREGNTALHLAADKNNHQACSKISVGVHVTEPKSGMTALDALRVNGHLMNRENDKKMQVPQDDEDKIKLFSFLEITLIFVFLWGHTIAFLLAIVSGFILLPVGRTYTCWYVLISAPLFCSYPISMYLKHRLLLRVHLLTVLGVVLCLLVFYMKWKRTTQKKYQNSEMT